MKKVIKNKFTDYLLDNSGATAVEYGLIAALIGVSIIIGGKQVGDALNNKFECTAEVLNSDDNTTSCATG